ncbi:hypothetical protein DFJ73DRAFT_802232 [Zopfochytrium polystomum]|nr:hypothetical protein DFJ73DRAFT_802232 [Zopfochytrium polystomum]
MASSSSSSSAAGAAASSLSSASALAKHPLRSLLDSTPCRALVAAGPGSSIRPKAPIYLDAEMTVLEGCAALAKTASRRRPASAGAFVGMLDYRDLVAYILNATRWWPSTPARRDGRRQAVCEGEGARVVVLDSAAAGGEGPGSAAGGDPKEAFLGVLSQSSVAALVAEHFGTLPTTTAAAAADADLAHRRPIAGGPVPRARDVLSVSATAPVLDALALMHAHGVSSVAVLPPSDRALLSSSSSSTSSAPPERRRARRNHTTNATAAAATSPPPPPHISHPNPHQGWRRLYEPSYRFFVSLRNAQGVVPDGGGAQAAATERVPSFTVAPETPLVVAIEKMAATRGHRVWVTSSSSSSSSSSSGGGGGAGGNAGNGNGGGGAGGGGLSGRSSAVGASDPPGRVQLLRRPASAATLLAPGAGSSSASGGGGAGGGGERGGCWRGGGGGGAGRGGELERRDAGDCGGRGRGAA